MYISQARMTNYRCFEDITIEFNQGLNVIIGENNSGKTTILKALGLIFDRSNAQKPTTEDFYRKVSLEKPPQITITVTIREADDENITDKAVVASWLTKVSTPWEATLTYIYFLPENYVADYLKDIQELKGETQPNFWLLLERYIPKYVSRIYGGKPEARNRVDFDLLEKFDCQSLDALRDVESKMLTGKNPLLKQVLNHYKDYNLKDKPKEIKDREVKKNQDEFRDDAQKLVEKLCNRLTIDNILDLAKSTGASVGGLPFIGGYLEESDVISALKLMIRASDIEIPIAYNGLGYNNLIFISLVMSSLEMITSSELGENAKIFPILLIEEPEAHLHPALQYTFLRFLKKEINKNQFSRQIFITSHSTHITAAVNLDSIICLSTEVATTKIKVSYPGRVFSDSPDDKESKRYIETYLDATKSNILFSKGIIFVEGITELLLIPTISEYLGLSLEERHVTTVRVDGSTFKHFIKLFGGGIANGKEVYALPRNISCLVDTDPQKKEKTKGSRWKACWPFELNSNPDKFEYKDKSGVISNLEDISNKANIKISYNKTGKGKTFEYDLMLSNINASKKPSPLMVEEIKIGKDTDDYRKFDHALSDSKWVEDELIKARIAGEYLLSIDKGENAFYLERRLRDNLNKSTPDKQELIIPDHVKEAIQWVCS